MQNTAHVFAWITNGVLIGMLLVLYLGWWSMRKGARKQAAPTTVPSQPASRWKAMPGNTRIELEDSGFAIALVATRTQFVYELHSPEGLVLTHAVDLTQLMAVGERLAGERKHFECTSLPIDITKGKAC
jgi:hypothetical protein